MHRRHVIKLQYTLKRTLFSKGRRWVWVNNKERCEWFINSKSKIGLTSLTPDEIQEKFPDGIELIQVSRTNASPDIKFNFEWFLPAIKRHRSTLLLVLGSSFVVQLFTLANPLLIQVIIDKVISQRSLDTLQVLGIALVAVTVFEGILTSLRTFLFTDTTNRIDMRLGASDRSSFTTTSWLF